MIDRCVRLRASEIKKKTNPHQGRLCAPFFSRFLIRASLAQLVIWMPTLLIVLVGMIYDIFHDVIMIHIVSRPNSNATLLNNSGWNSVWPRTHFTIHCFVFCFPLLSSLLAFFIDVAQLYNIHSEYSPVVPGRNQCKLGTIFFFGN